MAAEVQLPPSPPHHSPAMAMVMTPVSSAASATTPSSAESIHNLVMPFSSSASMAKPHGDSSYLHSAATNQIRRPPRKSTLTQQQKNHKRQRATPDQLATLECEFNKNPTPAGDIRERIAEQINMTERSVQIWFQNRRAKIKSIAKKSIETGEDIDCIPESMRQYLALQAIETGKGPGNMFIGRTGLGSYAPFFGDGTGKVVIQHLECGSLRIGSWTRIAQSSMDLIVFASPAKSTMTYYIHTEQAGYKIEYPFSHIKNIQLESSDGDPHQMSGLTIELVSPPFFFMDSSTAASGFVHVGDFTEDLQASSCLTHHLGGNPKRLSSQLAKLVSLASFQQRHNHLAFGQRSMPLSAPVSPVVRASSQPNFAQPHVGMFQESWGIVQPPNGMRAGMGHRRQRSRSVPGPVDFSLFNTQMPSFYIQQPHDLAPPRPHETHSDIYAPIPHQPLGPNLRIDTQAGYGLDTRQYPLSATTMPSPADFSGSHFFTSGGTPLSTSTFNGPYGGPYLSAMVHQSSLILPSVSPLSFVSHTEPSIVGQSPPLSMMHRPGSVDIYAIPEGSCAVSDDGIGLNEMYSKHSITLPMHPHSPAFIQPGQAQLDLSHLATYDPVESGSLSPDTIP